MVDFSSTDPLSAQNDLDPGENATRCDQTTNISG